MTERELSVAATNRCECEPGGACAFCELRSALRDSDFELVSEKLRAADAMARINTPHTADFLEAVKLEAEHQRSRWGTDHDTGKEPADWFWLLGWLAGKAVHAAVRGDREKALHHTISSAAVLLNWHAHMSGSSTVFRPGIEPPERPSLSTFEDLGDISAVDPPYSVPMHCVDCRVQWRGCADVFQCPRCGKGEPPWMPNES